MEHAEHIVAASIDNRVGAEWVGFDMHLAAGDLAKLSPEQLVAVYDGARQLATRSAEVTA